MSFTSACALVASFAAFLFLTACQTTGAGSASPSVPYRPPGSTTNSLVGSDLIWAGDKLVISFSDLPQPERPFEVIVTENGQITLPENKRLNAGGKTKVQLEQEIRDLYVPGYYARLTVNVTTPDHYFTVMGEVKGPNSRQYLPGMTVLKAIAAVGGFTEYANKTVEITRANQVKERVNTKKAQKHPALDLPIYPGDLIVVPRRVL